MTAASRSISLGDVSVAIGMPIHRDLPPATVMSLIQTIDRLNHLGVPCDVLMESSGAVIMGRDAVLDTFLKGDKQKLFWIDSDMTWDASDFVRMLAISTQVDILCAAYPAKVDGPPQFFAQFKDGPAQGEFGLFEIDAVGLGFTVIDRKVLEQIASTAPRLLDQLSKREMASVFRFDIFEGNRRTEDMAFFADLRALGRKVWLDPQVSLGHVGQKEFRGSIGEALQAKPKAAA